MKPKAYSYVRFSTPDQAKGDSLRLGVVLSCALAAAGCYSPQSVREAEVVYSAGAERPAVEVADCVRNRYLLENDFPLEMAYDERTGVVRVTSVSRYDYAIYGGVWNWEATISPRDPTGSHVEIRSNRSMWGPLIGADTLKMIEDCSARREQ